jgi:hypothetical protein
MQRVFMPVHRRPGYPKPTLTVAMKRKRHAI